MGNEFSRRGLDQRFPLSLLRVLLGFAVGPWIDNKKRPR